MLPESDHLCLSAMALVEEMSRRLGTISYIWGGCALDVYEGRFLRPHHDIDYMVLDLARLEPQFAALFEEHGWTSENIAGVVLAGRREGIHVALGFLDVGAEARWHYNGPLGYVTFPAGWLCAEPVPFYDISVHVVAPELEYVFKSRSRLLGPDWNLEERHRVARDRLAEILRARGVDLEALYPHVSAWNSAASKVFAPK